MLGFLCLGLLSIGIDGAAASPISEEPKKDDPSINSGVVIPPEKQVPTKIGEFATAPVIDGKLDDEVWRHAGVLKDFYQIQPGDNIAPSKPTEILIGHDSKHLYIAFRCYDERDKVRATIPKRDAIFDDDYVGAYLDTLDDQRRAYVIFFSPLGIQADGIFTEGRGEDYSVDIVMESKGLVHEEGYTVEVAIPFKSIRYEAGEGQNWGAHFFRRIKRGSNELSSWMPNQRARSGSLIQAGKLTGFTGIDTEHTLEIIPSITLSETGRRVPAETPADAPFINTRILNKPLESDIGLTMKYTITPTVTLDFAANPDFAQVEADQLVVTANQRFPIFFEEKRPFFLEGIDIFQTQMNVVNTRRIVDPDVAVKLSGKQGRNTFSFLLASDNAPGNFSDEERSDPDLLPRIERFLDKNAYIAVARVKRDVGRESNVGFFATTYNFIERHNHLAGFDGRFRLSPKTIVAFQTVGTSTRGLFYDPEEDERRYRTGNGFGYFGQLDFTDRNFGYQLNLSGRTRDYRADVGFTRRVNTNAAEYFMRFSSDPKPDSTYIGYRLITFSAVNYDWDGRNQSWFQESRMTLNFKRESFFEFGGSIGHETLYEDEFGRSRAIGRTGAFFGAPERSAYQKNFAVAGGSTISKQFSFFTFFSYTSGAYDFDFGAGPLYPRVSPAALADPNAPLDPGPGGETFIEASVAFQPTSELRTTLSYIKSKLSRHDTDRVAFDDNIVSLRTTYQFSRFTFARIRLDYDSLTQRAFGQYLLGWTPNPGTAFYAGYNDDLSYNGFSPFDGRREPGLRLNGRTFFVKMTYLFRHSL